MISPPQNFSERWRADARRAVLCAMLLQLLFAIILFAPYEYMVNFKTPEWVLFLALYGVNFLCVLFLDLYGVSVRPVVPFGSASRNPYVDSALIHQCLPDDMLFEAPASCCCFQSFLLCMILEYETDELVESMPLAVSLTTLLEELSSVIKEMITFNPRKLMYAMSQYIPYFDLTSQQMDLLNLMHSPSG